MDKIIVYLLLMIANLYSQCDNYNQSQCSNDNNCEWIEDIGIGNCSVFDNSESSCTNYTGECFWDEDITYASCNYPNSGSCNSVEGCYWDCSDYGWYCDCNGQQQIIDTECIGQYEIDNSYCQETEMPECSELDQNICNHPLYGEGCDWIQENTDCDNINSELSCNSNNCDWIEDIDNGSCMNLSFDQCSGISDCEWAYGCIQMGWWYNWCYEYGYECQGTYQIDNSYCNGETGYCDESWNILGDLNFDGTINIQDIILVVNIILSDEFQLIADLNLDSTVNVLDVIQLVNIIFG